MSVVDKIALLKEKRLKQRSVSWITSELLDDIRARDQALETFRKNKTDENYKYFCNLRNRVNIKKVLKKRLFFQQNFRMQEFIYRHMESCEISGFY